VRVMVAADHLRAGRNAAPPPVDDRGPVVYVPCTDCGQAVRLWLSVDGDAVAKCSCGATLDVDRRSGR
jgi:hypothetical protein